MKLFLSALELANTNYFRALRGEPALVPADCERCNGLGKDGWIDPPPPPRFVDLWTLPLFPVEVCP